MKVRDVMEVNIVTVAADATYETVAKILCENDISGVPVVDANRRLVGVVSEKDLFRILYPYYRSYYFNPELYNDFEIRENKIEEIRDHPVSGFMSKDILWVAPDDPVMRAGAIMLAHSIHRLPVIEQGSLVGMISRKNIYGQILRQHLGN